MIDPNRHAALEERLRTDLHRDALTRWPAQPAPPLRLPESATPRRRRAWTRPVLVALAAAAVIIGSYALIVDHRSPGRSQTPPAGSAQPQPSTPTSSTSDSTSAPTDHYPEADEVPGVHVSTRSTTLGAVADFFSVVPVSLRATLQAGRAYRFVARFGYQAMPDDVNTPYVFGASSTDENISCAGPFLVRSGHTYDIDCTLTPTAGHGSVTFAMSGTDGSANGSDQVPITAAAVTPSSSRSKPAGHTVLGLVVSKTNVAQGYQVVFAPASRHADGQFLAIPGRPTTTYLIPTSLVSDNGISLTGAIELTLNGTTVTNLSIVGG